MGGRAGARVWRTGSRRMPSRSGRPTHRNLRGIMSSGEQGTRFLSTNSHLFFHPDQYGRNNFLAKLAVDGEAVRHAVNLEIARVSGMGLVHDLRDGFAIGAAHDGVGGATNACYWLVDLLPCFVELYRLQLSVE